jgi:hypothetical protein
LCNPSHTTSRANLCRTQKSRFETRTPLGKYPAEEKNMLVWIGKVLRSASLVKSIAFMFIRYLSGGKDYKNVTKQDQETKPASTVFIFN